jgi:hypothetical protein
VEEKDMTRRQWTGLAALLTGVSMITGIFISGSTPDSSGAGAVERYAKYWAEGDNQDKASLGGVILTFATVLLVLTVAGLRNLLARAGDSGLSTVVATAGTAAAAMFGAGAALINGAGLAAAEADFAAEGTEALLVEGIGYYTLTASIMCAAAMAMAFSLANRTARVVPQWTMVFSALLALVALGSIYAAWLGFMLLPLWGVVIGIVLLVTRGADDEVVTTA